MLRFDEKARENLEAADRGLTNEEVPSKVSALFGGRPVRWAPPALLVGDFEGRSRTLEVFNAEPGAQRALLRTLRPHRETLEAAAGGPIISIFHTRSESKRLYADFLAEMAPELISPKLMDWQTLPPGSLDALRLPLFDRDVAEGEIRRKIPRQRIIRSAP